MPIAHYIAQQVEKEMAMTALTVLALIVSSGTILVLVRYLWPE